MIQDCNSHYAKNITKRTARKRFKYIRMYHIFKTIVAHAIVGKAI